MYYNNGIMKSSPFLTAYKAAYEHCCIRCGTNGIIHRYDKSTELRSDWLTQSVTKASLTTLSFSSSAGRYTTGTTGQVTSNQTDRPHRQTLSTRRTGWQTRYPQWLHSQVNLSMITLWNAVRLHCHYSSAVSDRRAELWISTSVSQTDRQAGRPAVF